MKEAISFGHGIRLLRQDFQETLISFLISQNNGIPRIRKIVEGLAQSFGEPISFSKPDVRTFPTCENCGDQLGRFENYTRRIQG